MSDQRPHGAPDEPGYIAHVVLEQDRYWWDRHARCWLITRPSSSKGVVAGLPRADDIAPLGDEHLVKVTLMLERPMVLRFWMVELLFRRVEESADFYRTTLPHPQVFETPRAWIRATPLLRALHAELDRRGLDAEHYFDAA